MVVFHFRAGRMFGGWLLLGLLKCLHSHYHLHAIQISAVSSLVQCQKDDIHKCVCVCVEWIFISTVIDAGRVQSV